MLNRQLKVVLGGVILLGVLPDSQAFVTSKRTNDPTQLRTPTPDQGVPGSLLRERVTNFLSSQSNNYLDGSSGYVRSVLLGDRNFLKNQFVSYTNEQTRQYFKSLLPNADVSIGINHDENVEGSIVFLKPLNNHKTENVLRGWQGSLFIEDQRYTVNNGYVYRQLSADETRIWGANIFFDVEFPYGHQRMSIGGEYKSSYLDLIANHYVPITGWKEGRNGLKERAMEGSSLNLQTPIPYVPRLRFDLGYANWKTKDISSDFNGYTYSLIGQVTPHVTMTLSQRSMNDSKDTVALKVTYSLNAINENKRFNSFISNVAYPEKTVKHRMLEKVARENVIRKQTSGLIIVTK